MPRVLISKLTEAERFVLHLKFAREQGIVPGAQLPVEHRFVSKGVWLDPAKADTVAYLENGPPPTDWRRLCAEGCPKLVARGIGRPNGRQALEMIDRFDFDLSMVVTLTATMPRAS